MSAGAAGNPAFAFAEALLAGLAAGGVRHVCTCPGSRSAPLAVAATRTPGLRAWTHVDERSAGFFALGLARAAREPAAVLCTSGTAAANLLPAVAEAAEGRVPLVVLTADRPPELVGWGAGQTLDQRHLFGSRARWFAEGPVPVGAPGETRFAGALGARAAAAARRRPRGPVHLNLPFREPLHPTPVEVATDARVAPAPPRVRGADAEPAPELVDEVAAAVCACERGVLLCGPHDGDPAFPEAAVRLARAAGWPLMADVLSGVRGGPHAKEAPIVATADAWLRDEALAAELAPERTLRFGATPTSKAVRAWLARHRGAASLLVDPDGAWPDPDHAATGVVVAEPAALAHAVAERLERAPGRGRGDWLRRWREADRRAGLALASALAAEPRLLEPRVVREIAAALPEGATLFLSSSMPVRDADGFWPVSSRAVRMLGNRGANGIDGVVSTALGARAASAGPLVLLTGDLALLHDLGGLLAARRHGLAVAIVVIDNDGGGIFGYLPIAARGEAVRFTEQFVGPHGLDWQHAARLFDLGFARADTPEALRVALRDALAAPRTTLVSVPCDREASIAHHRALWERAAAAAKGTA